MNRRAERKVPRSGPSLPGRNDAPSPSDLFEGSKQALLSQNLFVPSAFFAVKNS